MKVHVSIFMVNIIQSDSDINQFECMAQSSA